MVTKWPVTESTMEERHRKSLIDFGLELFPTVEHAAGFFFGLGGADQNSNHFGPGHAARHDGDDHRLGRHHGRRHRRDRPVTQNRHPGN